jgi:hypothetical protein
MDNLEVDLMIDVENLIPKFDTNGIENLVRANFGRVNAFHEQTGVLLVCRNDAHKFKQFDHWNRKGLACYSVIIPYEKALSDETSKEELTKICADLVVECLLFWAEKKQKRAAKTRAKAA